VMDGSMGFAGRSTEERWPVHQNRNTPPKVSATLLEPVWN
jgi:hypothetical protein